MQTSVELTSFEIKYFRIAILFYTGYLENIILPADFPFNDMITSIDYLQIYSHEDVCLLERRYCI